MINHAMQRIRKLEDRFDQIDQRLARIEQLLRDQAEKSVSRETPAKTGKKKQRVLPQ